MATHNTVANFIALLYKTTHQRIGVDIVTPEIAIEVESYDTVAQAMIQLSIYYDRPVYCAGVDDRTTKKALQYYRNSDVGVMNQLGIIMKISTRGQK